MEQRKDFSADNNVHLRCHPNRFGRGDDDLFFLDRLFIFIHGKDSKKAEALHSEVIRLLPENFYM